MANRKANLYGGFSDFHVGNFLRDILREEGHDLDWLADRLSIPPEILSCILTQPNMDAELFVRIGKPMEPLFMQRVDEVIFGKQPAKAVNRINEMN